MNAEQTEHKEENIKERGTAKPVWKRTLLAATAIITALIVTMAGYTGYIYAATPVSIRQPLYEHYHFRMQVIVAGKTVNFGQAAFQEGYAKDNCNAALTTHPIHFHDSKDQFVHIHWEGMTGGQVLKYYGWNFIGGTAGSLGYRFDNAPKLQKVPIHGNAMPAIPDNTEFYVYSGDENGYKQRSLDEFTGQDLEKFFGKVSNSPSHKLNKQKREGLASMLVPKVAAHETGAAHAEPTSGSGLSDEQLKVLNNLIGNVVIFVQKEKPGDAQIKGRFNNLEPLSESSCAG